MFDFGDFIVDKCGNSETYFIADKSVEEEVKKCTWTLDGHGYVCRNNRGKLERLHSLTIEKNIGRKVPSDMYIDHVNECKTDNRLCNLRIVSPKDSAKNMPIKRTNTSGFTGVCPSKKGRPYRAYITINKKQISLGTYNTAEDAARARYAAEEQYGFKHRQNLLAFLNDASDCEAIGTVFDKEADNAQT